MDYRKGQLTVDFYIAFIVFLGFLAYITFQLFQITPASSASLRTESVKIEAYQISEMLVNDEGSPTNWYEISLVSGIQRIGLSDSTKGETNYLSSDKVERFEDICDSDSGYNNIKDLLGITGGFSITIIKHTPDSDASYNCNLPSIKKERFTVSRTVIISDSNYPTELVVEAWRT